MNVFNALVQSDQACDFTYRPSFSSLHPVVSRDENKTNKWANDYHPMVGIMTWESCKRLRCCNDSQPKRIRRCRRSIVMQTLFCSPRCEMLMKHFTYSILCTLERYVFFRMDESQYIPDIMAHNVSLFTCHFNHKWSLVTLFNSLFTFPSFICAPDRNEYSSTLHWCLSDGHALAQYGLKTAKN